MPPRVPSRWEGTVHSADVGDQKYSTAAWLPQEPRRVEQFELHLPRPVRGLELQYMCHLQDIGDSPWLNAGTPCGTTGESRRMEAFAFRLAGPAARDYTVRYWCLVEGAQTPSGPYADGELCGTKGESRALLGMKVELVKRPAPPRR
ncbi:hypothetical protein [Vitiosangium sp. GDMCC 1.1324]|uniref:hypothetical protein n=1 Tax=Vitiosangium sp. (strain GDMCC 1.1324) TaxID=2138576 RepID=UPI000D356EC7|nr:hypothetical protein [Vitiosangium sp. GDMCC 1.1324]PTL83004.1 hypothetical protein DAT35_13355 [Vitiosangium sp. GDMCC 1.1324]